MRGNSRTSRSRDGAASKHPIAYAGPAQPLLPGTRPYRVANRVLARALGASLDRRLAAGTPPESARLLAVRARDIVQLGRREAVARYWERTLRVARQPGAAAACSVPLRRQQVLAAEPAIRDLARLLRVPLPVGARGVAIARVLLTDGGGPLYWTRSPVSLHDALAEAITWLDPALPLMGGWPERGWA